MFGDLLGNMEGKQAALKEKLAAIQLSASAGDGAVKVTVTGNQQVVDVAIDKEKIDLSDTEQLEDLLMVALNQALAMAVDTQTQETNNLVKDMIPPGLSGLGDLFGK